MIKFKSDRREFDSLMKELHREAEVMRELWPEFGKWWVANEMNSMECDEPMALMRFEELSSDAKKLAFSEWHSAHKTCEEEKRDD